MECCSATKRRVSVLDRGESSDNEQSAALQLELSDEDRNFSCSEVDAVLHSGGVKASSFMYAGHGSFG